MSPVLYNTREKSGQEIFTCFTEVEWYFFFVKKHYEKL